MSLSIHICCATTTTVHLQNFSSSQTETLYLLNNNSPFFHPHQPLVTTVLLSVSRNLTALGASYSGIIQYLHFCVWLISFRLCSQASSMLQHVSEVHSFLRLNNIPLYVQTTFCLSIHLLVDILVVSTFCLL